MSATDRDMLVQALLGGDSATGASAVATTYLGIVYIELDVVREALLAPDADTKTIANSVWYLQNRIDAARELIGQIAAEQKGAA